MIKEEKWLLTEKYRGKKTAGFFADCARLEAGEPLAYVIGSIPFLNCDIDLGSKPLIPRPETEWWVEQAIAEIAKSAAATPPHILDLCAGSGCVGIAVAKSVPIVQIDFAELEARHAATIEKNCEQNDVQSDRYQIYVGDLFENVTQEYDFILTNPPYIDPALDQAERSVKDFEPEVALYGGEGGMEIIKQIIETAPQYLNPGGQLWIEHEPEQSKDIRELGRNSFLTTTHTDQYQVERYSQLVLQ